MLYEQPAIKIVAFSSSLPAKKKKLKRQTNSSENCIDKLQSFYSRKTNQKYWLMLRFVCPIKCSWMTMSQYNYTNIYKSILFKAWCNYKGVQRPTQTSCLKRKFINTVIQTPHINIFHGIFKPRKPNFIMWSTEG